MQAKAGQQVDEYFARREFERRKQVLAGPETHSTEEERQHVLAVAGGRCPKCAAQLVPIRYRGVQLDKCSRCQGGWLDFGELDHTTSEDTGFLAGVRRIFT